MTSFIPRLARISSRSGAKRGAKAAPGRTGARTAPMRINIEYLAGLVPTIRRRLAIAPTFSDEAIFASLAAIAAASSYETRWRAAEASTLGLFLRSHGNDLKESLITLLALLPKPYL